MQCCSLGWMGRGGDTVVFFISSYFSLFKGPNYLKITLVKFPNYSPLCNTHTKRKKPTTLWLKQTIILVKYIRVEKQKGSGDVGVRYTPFFPHKVQALVLLAQSLQGEGWASTSHPWAKFSVIVMLGSRALQYTRF